MRPEWLLLSVETPREVTRLHGCPIRQCLLDALLNLQSSQQSCGPEKTQAEFGPDERSILRC